MGYHYPHARLSWPIVHARSDQAAGILQRVLLTSDGTVTRIIEAYAGEPIGVVKLAHVLIEPGHAGCPELDLGSEEPLLERKVLLRGRGSGTNFVYAEALIALHRLPAAVRDGLLLSDTPIGTLLAEHRVETWKEMARSGCEPAGDCAAALGIAGTGTVWARSYRVFSAQRPVMAVTEKFPSSAFIT